MAAEKSVIVQGKSVEEALERASLLLHASTADLAHEILQQGLVDQRGIVRVPYKLRVLPIVSPPAPRAEVEWTEEALPPPFSKKELTTWSNEEFVQALQHAIANQPASELEPELKRKPFSEPPLEVRGGLSSFYGSIVHDGDVIIHGSVSKGVTVTASGSILVEGDVEVSQLDAGDNIRILGGMLGIARSTYGSVTCLFAQGAYIESKGQINIVESTLHSNLVSGSIVDVGSTIIGGTATAPQAIYARITGSESGVLTRLFAGSNSLVREDAEAVRRRAARLVLRLGEVNNVIKQIEPAERSSKMTSVEDRMALWAAMSEKAQLNDKLVALSRKKNHLLASIDRDRSARIKISDKVYPQTQIEIDDVSLTIKKLTQFVTFSKDYEAGALRVTSFR